MILQPNTLFHDRYLLQELKGRGSFGEVWLARDKKLDIDVAIKVYIALDTRGVEEFTAEYRTAFGLNHPNLLHALHYDTFEDRPYLVMPYCPNSAMDLIGNIDEPTMWRMLRDVASGLSYLHSLGIVHHDIKPDNILIDKNNNFVITDFGISVKFRSTLRRNSARELQKQERSGSIPYMGPEMFAQEAEAVNATDIWALGVSMYEMLNGELPFFGQGGAMQLNGAQVPDLQGDWSDNLKKVVKMCLAPQSWDRPSAQQLVNYAEAALNGEADLFKVGGNKKQKTSKWLMIGIVAAIIIVGGIFGGMYAKKKADDRKRQQKEQEEHDLINKNYAEMATTCMTMVENCSTKDREKLFSAKDEIGKILIFEERNADRLDSIVGLRIKDSLDVKLRAAAQEWANAAESQVKIQEYYQALDFYQYSLRLYELPEVREAYNELQHTLSKPLTDD